MKNKESFEEQKEVNKKIIRLSSSADIEGIEGIISIVKKAYSEVGYEVEIVHLPANRAIMENTLESTIDGELLRPKAIEKTIPNLIRIPVVLRIENVAAFYINKGLRIDSMKSLKSLNIVSLRGYALVEKMLEDYKVVKVKNAQQAFKMLLAQRADVVVVPKPFGTSIIKNQKLSNVMSFTIPKDFHLCHYINARHKALIPALTKAFSKITGNEIEKD